MEPREKIAKLDAAMKEDEEEEEQSKGDRAEGTSSDVPSDTDSAKIRFDEIEHVALEIPFALRHFTIPPPLLFEDNLNPPGASRPGEKSGTSAGVVELDPGLSVAPLEEAAGADDALALDHSLDPAVSMEPLDLGPSKDPAFAYMGLFVKGDADQFENEELIAAESAESLPDLLTCQMDTPHPVPLVEFSDDDSYFLSQAEVKTMPRGQEETKPSRQETRDLDGGVPKAPNVETDQQAPKQSDAVKPEMSVDRDEKPEAVPTANDRLELPQKPEPEKEDKHEPELNEAQTDNLNTQNTNLDSNDKIKGDDVIQEGDDEKDKNVEEEAEKVNEDKDPSSSSLERKRAPEQDSDAGTQADKKMEVDPADAGMSDEQTNDSEQPRADVAAAKSDPDGIVLDKISADTGERDADSPRKAVDTGDVPMPERPEDSQDARGYPDGNQNTDPIRTKLGENERKISHEDVPESGTSEAVRDLCDQGVEFEDTESADFDGTANEDTDIPPGEFDNPEIDQQGIDRPQSGTEVQVPISVSPQAQDTEFHRVFPQGTPESPREMTPDSQEPLTSSAEQPQQCDTQLGTQVEKQSEPFEDADTPTGYGNTQNNIPEFPAPPSSTQTEIHPDVSRCEPDKPQQSRNQGPNTDNVAMEMSPMDTCPDTQDAPKVRMRFPFSHNTRTWSGQLSVSTWQLRILGPCNNVDPHQMPMRLRNWRAMSDQYQNFSVTVSILSLSGYKAHNNKIEMTRWFLI